MSGDSRRPDPSDSAPEPERSLPETGDDAESAVPTHSNLASRAAHSAAERARAAAESVHQAISPDPVEEVGTEWLVAALADTAAITLPNAADSADSAEPPQLPDAPTTAITVPDAAGAAASSGSDASSGMTADEQPTEAISLEQLGELGREPDAVATASQANAQARARSSAEPEALSLADIVAAVAAAQATSDAALESSDADGVGGSASATAPTAAIETTAAIESADDSLPLAEPVAAATTPSVVPEVDRTDHPADPRVALTLPPEMRRDLLTPIPEPTTPAVETVDPDSEEALARVAAGLTVLPPELGLGRDSVSTAASAADADQTRALDLPVPSAEPVTAEPVPEPVAEPVAEPVSAEPVPDPVSAEPVADTAVPAETAASEAVSAEAVSTETVALDTAAFHADADSAEPSPAEPVDAEPVHAQPVIAEAEPAEPVPAEPVPAEPTPASNQTEAFDTAAFHAAADAAAVDAAEVDGAGATTPAAAAHPTEALDTAAFHRHAEETERARLVFTDPTPSAAIDLPVLPAMAAAGALSDTAAIDIARDAASADSDGPTDPPRPRGIAGWSFGKRLGLAFIVGAIVALVLIGTQVPRLFGIGAVSEPAATVTETPPPAAATKVAWNDLEPGACLTGFDSAWAETFTVVDCAAEHTAQLVFVAPISPTADAEFPGEAELVARSALVCSAPEAYSRTAADELTTLQIQASYPVTAKEWDQGHRSYSCFASLSDGAALPGSLVFGAE